MRDSIVSGRFYEADAELLKKQIKECFLSDFGPGKLPEKSQNQIKAVICPHAGYAFSGPCAAHCFKAVAEAEQPDLYIILGPSHSGFGNSVSLEDWKTPLGVAKVDKDFGEALIKNGFEHNEAAHEGEHSIEVQLPFMQYTLKDFSFIPLIVSDYKPAAAIIKKTIEQTKKRVIFIVSSDFTHYGTNYGYVPFTGDIKNNMYKLDNGAIDKIKNLDAKGFLDYIGDTGATICGMMPIATVLNYLTGSKVELLKYYTSADISEEDYNMAVGYAAIRFI